MPLAAAFNEEPTALGRNRTQGEEKQANEDRDEALPCPENGSWPPCSRRQRRQRLTIGTQWSAATPWIVRPSRESRCFPAPPLPASCPLRRRPRSAECW